MKILLDECITKRLKKYLEDFEVVAAVWSLTNSNSVATEIGIKSKEVINKLLQ